MSASGCSPFEGTEKKVEMAVDPSLPSFRDRGDDYWTGVAARAGAGVVSKISNEHCDAYVLSESSLFVWDHKILMLTCGRTTLHDAVLELLRTVPAGAVTFLAYQRKNEVFPRDQPTSFFDDFRTLNRKLPGRAFQFGHEDEHHLYLFHLGGKGPSDPQDTTLEILMYGIDPAIAEQFSLATHRVTHEVRGATGVGRILDGFRIDDHLFEPTGYSLNGIRDRSYYAVHVTPESTGSYASFETNQRFECDRDEVVGRVLEVFRPRSFDVVLFDTTDGEPRLSDHGYRRRCHVSQALDCGYRVRFISHYRPQTAVASAIELTLPGVEADVEA